MKAISPLIAVRPSAVLTTSYVAGVVLKDTDYTPVYANDAAGPVTMAVDYSAQDANQLMIYADFTVGSLTTAEIIVEFSADNVNWYQECFRNITAGTDTVTLGIHQIGATGKYRIPVAIKDRYIRISAKGTGTVTNSLMKIDAYVGIV